MKLSHVVLSVFLLVVLATSVQAQWAQWGAVTDYVDNDELGYPGAAADGANGVVVAWSDNAAKFVYATRYNENGSVNWGPVQVGPIDYSTLSPVQVVRQGSNWFVAWFDPDDVNTVHIYKIRIAKLNSSGSVVASTSVTVNEFDEVVDVLDLTLVARTGGGVAAGWRIEGDGHARLFSSDLSSSVDLGTFEGEYGYPINSIRVVADGADGVFAIWGQGYVYPYQNVMAQRYNSSGSPQWASAAVVVDNDGYPGEIAVVGDGSGGFVAAVQWENWQGPRLRVQHMSSSGSTSWNDNAVNARGKTLCAYCPDQSEPHVVINNSQDAAVFSWFQFSGGQSAIYAQKVSLSGSFAVSWDPAGIRANVGTYLEIGRHQLASNIDDQTTIAWPYRNVAYTTAGVNFQIIGDDGDVELGTDGQVLSPMTGTTPIEMPALVSLPIGACAPTFFYTGTYCFIMTYNMLPPAVFDVEYTYNEIHCNTPISWRTLPGSTQNKLKYRTIGSGTWSSKNAYGSGSMWSSSVSAYAQMEFKMAATFGGVLTYESGVYQQWYYCGPDPEGAPMAAQPAVEAYLRAHPNPFNPQVTMDYGVPATSRVELAVFDASGRRVKTLVSGTKAPGTYSETWDGTGEMGGRVASGVYFSRLIVDGKSITQKLVMLK